MTNRLATEASPYLVQHAHNPVDWYPWGPEALQKAKTDDRPILLSIGYSACHWCHVMERESFEDEGIARLMNERFVNVKVDREERPDLDQVYQLVVQLMGRSGGWPLTVFLTPDERPFFGGTYFPPTDRHGLPGFPRVLEAISEAFRTRRAQVDQQAGELAQAITRAAAGEAAAQGGISPHALAYATGRLAERFDDTHGGFGHRPKFPNTPALELFLRAGDHAPVKKTLDAMCAGGVWDHLGGGFHRYSTDERWLVPHFEKMLYDNAQLLRLCVEAWRALGEPRYEQTARDIATYAAREMTATDGGFFATQDADSEGAEGKFFVWTESQVRSACGEDAEAAAVALLAFDVTPGGNFEGTGATVLSTPTPLGEIARTLSMTPEHAQTAFERARALMFAARERRVKPFRDEKILSSWNGLMVGALAHAGAALEDASMIDAATRTLTFVEGALIKPETTERSRIERLCKGDVVRGPGFLDDYAFVGEAALDLYEATGAPRWVTLARRLAESILAHFYDPHEDGFFVSADDAPRLLVRAKDAYDHAIPSGAAMACRLLLRLGTMVDPKYTEPAGRAVERLAHSATHSPLGMACSVALVDRLVRGSVDVVLVGPTRSPATLALAREVHRAYLPDRVLVWADPADPLSLEACRALWEGKASQPEPVAYVCRGRACSLPIREPRELADALRR
jgi:uncharacterized protein YyaL (SSP411 family)